MLLFTISFIVVGFLILFTKKKEMEAKVALLKEPELYSIDMNTCATILPVILWIIGA